MFYVYGECRGAFYEFDEIGNYVEDMKSFSVYPTGGYIEAEEARIFRFRFEPKQKRRNAEQYAGFIKLSKINCQIVEQDVGTGLHMLRKAASDTKQRKSSLISNIGLDVFDDLPAPKTLTYALTNSLRIFLFANIESPQVMFVPDKIDVGQVFLYQSEYRVIEIRNLSTKLPITVKYNKTGFVDVYPPIKSLEARSSAELAVTIKSLKTGPEKFELKFDLLFQPNSYSGLESVGVVHIPITYDCPICTTLLPPKFVLGITPLITNEVGILTDSIKFNDTEAKRPQSAVITASWKGKRNDSDIMAFPNDRPRSLRPYKGTRRCKTIFKVK